jgi:hypothetical protein
MSAVRAPGDRVDAIASLFVDDPERIRAVVDRLRADGAAVESTVRGTSMGTTLPEGTRIQIAISRDLPRTTGGVVAFLAGTQIVVHRLVHQGRWGAARAYVLCQGDGRRLPDRPIARSQLVGPVVGAFADGRWQPVGGRPRVQPVVAAASRVALVALAATLVVSPRGTERLLALMHRIGDARARHRTPSETH